MALLVFDQCLQLASGPPTWGAFHDDGVERFFRVIAKAVKWDIVSVLWSKGWLYKIKCSADFPGGPEARNSPFSVGQVGLIPAQGTEIPHAAGLLCTTARAVESCN